MSLHCVLNTEELFLDWAGATCPETLMETGKRALV